MVEASLVATDVSLATLLGGETEGSIKGWPGLGLAQPGMAIQILKCNMS